MKSDLAKFFLHDLRVWGTLPVWSILLVKKQDIKWYAECRWHCDIHCLYFTTFLTLISHSGNNGVFNYGKVLIQSMTFCLQSCNIILQQHYSQQSPQNAAVTISFSKPSRGLEHLCTRTDGYCIILFGERRVLTEGFERRGQQHKLECLSHIILNTKAI